MSHIHWYTHRHHGLLKRNGVSSSDGRTTKIHPKDDLNKPTDDCDDDPSQRLEKIKQGKKVVRFPADIAGAKILSPYALLLRTKRRKSMQERRGLTGEDANHDIETNKQSRRKQKAADEGDTLTQDELEDFEKYKKQLRRLRKEREDRRKRTRRSVKPFSKRKRRLRASQHDSSAEEEEEAEFEFTGHGAGKLEDKLQSADQSTTSEQIQPLNEASTVVCPLCQKTILAPSNDNADAALAQHMSSCQNGRSTRQRNRLSTPFSFTSYGRRVSRISYTEMEESDEIALGEGEEDDEKEATFRVEQDERVSEDDDELNVESIDDDDKEIITGREKKKKSLQGKTSHIKPTTLDDWDEDFYEDRVEEWIEVGLENMEIMKEQDTTENPPGEAFFEGGLVIPAWVNNRLFPYQRTGLQWMWELHLQQSGGILGDEMGLVSFLVEIFVESPLELIFSPFFALDRGKRFKLYRSWEPWRLVENSNPS